MQVPRPTDADIARFRSLVPADPDVEVRPMFGNLGAFVHGNMFMGLLGADIGLKLTGGDADELRSVEGGGAFGPPGRPMGGWALLPASARRRPGRVALGRPRPGHHPNAAAQAGRPPEARGSRALTGR